MTNWNDYIDKALERLSGTRKSTALPQLRPQTGESADITPLQRAAPRRERQVKQRLSYQLFEKMRRRSLSWKSYYYYDAYNIPRIAITNENATGTHIIERRYLVPGEKVFEASFYADDKASTILVDVNDLENVHSVVFDQLKAGEIRLYVYDKAYPLTIWFESNRSHAKQYYPLGRRKVFFDSQRAHLLRPFRNLGAEGFAALSSRLLAQEGIRVDAKSSLESLLIELGNEELLRYYQEALNLFNQQSSTRRIPIAPEEVQAPLIITKSHQRGRINPELDGQAIRVPSIPEEVYESLALVFEKHFSEIEEDLLQISLSALSLDRGAVTDGCAILKDKLCFYIENGVLQECRLEQLYQFAQRLAGEAGASQQEEIEYSPLEDEAYQEMLVDVLENIRDITSDFRYASHPPIRTQIDALRETVESLAQAFEDAEDKQRRREINDKRKILTQKAFELPNTGTYSADRVDGQPSFYGRLLEVQKTVHQLKAETQYAAYDVALSLAQSAYLLIHLHLGARPELQSVAAQLIELLQSKRTGDYQAFVSELVAALTSLADELHEIIKTETSRRLRQTSAKLEQSHVNGGLFSEEGWNATYLAFVHNEVAALNEQIRETAIEKYEEVEKELSDHFQLIETFISGVSVPALLPSQLHESQKGLQTFLVEQLKRYLTAQNLQLQSVPGRENQLRSLINELMPPPLETPLEQLEYFFMSPA